MMNNIALLQHIASELIAHSGVSAKPAFDKISADDEKFINELSPSNLLELLENPLPIIINNLTGEPHSVIHNHCEDQRPDSKTYGYGIGYEAGNKIIVLADEIDTYYHSLKAKQYLKSINYLPVMTQMVGLNYQNETVGLYY
ncbi:MULTISPECIES: hypothetical protein [Morganellaceae]|uniref:Uncharacterized protein n=1 Tax=Providencia rettgeri TaxID=587 RepID=U5N3F5_PRORE|nr:MULTISPECIES: hypothetical protein [Providencia]HEK0657650.1 hypothetical protein [Proteus mirabilis]AGX85721.1 hypothetical protein 09AY2001NDM_091 [Providencia rettgeri]MCR4182015.1 hypothetical protein [Providencia vermicola]UPF36269.1 hypothetical protein MXW51_000080 [Providencia stuartii]UPG23896.1 hypothetical protein KDV75_001190 [Providencia stuartii]